VPQLYANYTVAQGDTLEALAEKYLGDARQAQRLAQLNALRYPFISDDPEDQLGTPLFETRLALPFSTGLRLYLADADPVAFAEGGYVLLRGTGGATGADLFDIGVIFGFGTPGPGGAMVWSPAMSEDFDAATLASFGRGNLLYLTGQPRHVYAAGARVVLYPDQSQARRVCVGTGGVIRIPITAQNANLLTLAVNQFQDLFGSDLALGPDGQLSLAGRDLATVAGEDNLNQALRVRLTTEPGELVLHPSYGNPLVGQVGRPSRGVQAVAYAAAVRTLLADPRVARVQSVRIGADGDTVTVNAQVETADRAALIALATIIRPPGVTKTA
jgi:phage baseplate assembly protein W